MKKFFLLFLILTSTIFATTFSLRYENIIYTSDTNKYFSNVFTPDIKYQNDNFSFFVEMTFSNDGKFPLFYEEFYGDYYIKFKNSGINLNLNNVKISFGNLENYDIVDSPYSLFISSLGHSKPTVSFKFEDSNFKYESRYILISYDDFMPLNLSTKSSIDKGLNLKYYAIKYGNFTFGYEEASVYVNRLFDFEYFSNPLPNFFVQYYRENVLYNGIRSFNDNSLMGFFATYEDLKKYLYAQILIDDFNANRFFNPDNPTVDKIAWSFGGTYNLNNYLKAKIFSAGATKYTFQPSSDSGNPLYYGYTYFIVEKLKDWIINYEENYIGYKYGENNLALLIGLDYSKEFNLTGDLEFILSGTKSPINPWTEKNSSTYERGFNLLNEGKIEKTFLLSLNISKKFGIMELGGFIKLGEIFNVLKLVEEVNDNVKKPYYAPSDENKTIFDLSIFLKVSYNL